jgi:hypothetical protein
MAILFAQQCGRRISKSAINSFHESGGKYVLEHHLY